MGKIRALGVFRFQYYGQRERRILEVTSAICLAGERLFRGTVLLAYVVPTNAAIETGEVGGKILREKFEPLRRVILPGVVERAPGPLSGVLFLPGRFREKS